MLEKAPLTTPAITATTTPIGAIANNCCSEMWLAAERAVAAIGWIPMSANAALSVNTPDSTNGQLPSAPVNLISNAPRAKAAITETV